MLEHLGTLRALAATLFRANALDYALLRILAPNDNHRSLPGDAA